MATSTGWKITDAPSKSTSKNRQDDEQAVDDTWEKVKVSDEAVFAFEQPGFCNLEVLTGAQVVTNADGTISIDYNGEPAPKKPKKSKKKKKKEPKSREKAESQETTPESKKKSKKKTAKVTAADALASEETQEEGKTDESVPSTSEDADVGKSMESKKKVKKAKGKKKDKADAQADKQQEDDGDAEAAREDDLDMSAWLQFGFDEGIVKVLQQQKFDVPTEIQRQTLLPAIRDFRDILAAAPTGSGKTLCFGLPILQNILNRRSKRSKKKSKKAMRGQDDQQQDTDDVNGLQALILSPTRELAMQIHRHLVPFCKELAVGIAPIVGGMSAQKQERLLARQPEIVVATPGRLWELIAGGHEHFHHLEQLRYLVLDEADRMIERGHFKELDKLLARLPRPAKPAFPTAEDAYLQKLALKQGAAGDQQEEQGNEDEQEEGQQGEDDEDDAMDQGEDGTAESLDQLFAGIDDAKLAKMDESDQVSAMLAHLRGKGLNFDFHPQLIDGEGDEADHLKVEGEPREDAEDSEGAMKSMKELKTQDIEDMQRQQALKIANNVKRQTFLFSATLMPLREGDFASRDAASATVASIDRALKRVVAACGIREGFKQVDLSLEQRVAEQTLAQGLLETRVSCPAKEKDVYLFYFLKRYPGRTLIFTNTIEMLRRVKGTLDLLGIGPLALHAQMQQRQRLKNLDRFSSRDESILVATDVAARGLDIKGVQHVIHYQLPKTADSYVHRSGRTARAEASGLSLALIGPEDVAAYRKIIQSLNRSEELHTFPIEVGFLKDIKKRTSLASRIYQMQKQADKPSREQSWFQRNARAMDLELDDDMFEQPDTDDQRRVKKMESELKHLLRQAVVVESSKGAYVSHGTSGNLTLEPADVTAREAANTKTSSAGEKIINQ